MSKIKPGYLKIDTEQEEILWYDRKRVTPFALPWSFTKYKLTPTRLIVERGLFISIEEEVLLYRITDLGFIQGLIGKLNNTGTIVVLSNDVSTPRLPIKHVKNARQVRAALSQAIAEAREKEGVRMSEVIGDIDPF